jgi:dCMP deaminase
MERITREEMLMEVAHVVARRGTCSRAQVGVVFAREGRILATGYNGAPPGLPHCTHEVYYLSLEAINHETEEYLFIPDWVPQGVSAGTYYYDGRTVSTSPGCTVVSHAERNGIAFAAREGIRLGGSDAFCTHAPCLDCARALLGSGITSLTFQIPYRLTEGVELLRDAGILIVDLGDAV